MYRVVDNEFNRANYPDFIGKVSETPPSYAQVEKLNMEKIEVARWEAKGGKRFITLLRDDLGYTYRTNDSGGGNMGVFPNDEAAIAAMEAPWGPRVGPVTVLTSDFPSTKRVK